MLEKKRQKVLATLFTTAMILQCILPTAAQAKVSRDDSFSLNGSATYVAELSPNVLKVSDKTGAYLITIDDLKDGRKVTITNTSDGTSEYFIYNSVDNTLYSSYTHEEIKNPISGAFSTRSTTHTKTIYYSYSNIKRALGHISTGAAIVGYICSSNPGLAFFKVGANLVNLAAKAINGITNPSTNHGIYVVIRTTRHFRRRNHIPYHTTRELLKIGTY